jgi:hypothetical protein
MSILWIIVWLLVGIFFASAIVLLLMIMYGVMMKGLCVALQWLAERF